VSAASKSGRPILILILAATVCHIQLHHHPSHPASTTALLNQHQPLTAEASHPWITLKLHRLQPGEAPPVIQEVRAPAATLSTSTISLPSPLPPSSNPKSAASRPKHLRLTHLTRALDRASAPPARPVQQLGRPAASRATQQHVREQAWKPGRAGIC